MRAVQVSKHIWSLKTWMIFPIRVWVVIGEEGVTLVDTGISMMADGILRFIERLQAGPLQSILLTHGHPDHTGSINRIRKVIQVPVYAHPIEIPYMEGVYPYPRRKNAKSLIQKGIAEALPNDGEGFFPIAGLTPFHTPGHSPGHVIYYHEEDNVLLAGDLFTSKKGRLHRPMPMFTADMKEAVRSSSIVQRLQPAHLEVSHGNPVLQAADHLELYISETSKYIRSM